MQEALTKALLGNRENFVITETMQFIPNKPTQFITQKQLLQYTIFQNRIYTDTTRKRIVSIKNLDIQIKNNGESTTLQKHFLQMIIPQSTQPLLITVE